MTPARAAAAAAVADAHRREWATVLAATVRVAGDLDLAEECVQEAYAAALTTWARDGVPRSPAAWLTTTRRRHIERTAARLVEHGVARATALARAEVFNAMLAQLAADRIARELKASAAALRDAMADAYAAMFEPPLPT